MAGPVRGVRCGSPLDGSNRAAFNWFDPAARLTERHFWEWEEQKP